MHPAGSHAWGSEHLLTDQREDEADDPEDIDLPVKPPDLQRAPEAVVAGMSLAELPPAASQQARAAGVSKGRRERQRAPVSPEKVVEVVGRLGVPAPSPERKAPVRYPLALPLPLRRRPLLTSASRGGGGRAPC